MSEPLGDLGAEVAVLKEKVKNLEKVAEQVESLKWLIIKAAILVIIGTVSVGKAVEMMLSK